MNKNNKSGYTGVCFDNSSQKWRAYITVHNEKIKLGYFTHIEDAVLARKEAEKLYRFDFPGYKLIHYVLQISCGLSPDNPDYQSLYENAFPFLAKAALKYDGNLAFPTYAVKVLRSNIKNDCRPNFALSFQEFEQTHFKDKEILVDWLNGASLRKISSKYNKPLSSTQALIKSLIKKLHKVKVFKKVS